MPREGSVYKPARSYCTSCNRTLNWYENIPVISWLYLGGKCLCKKERVSIRYPLVEILAALAAASTYIKFGLTPMSFVLIIYLFSLIVITFIDFDFKIIPDLISFPGMTIGLLLGVTSEYTELFRCSPLLYTCPITQGVNDSLIGFLLGGGIFYLVLIGYYYATGLVGLGGGDIKLLAMTGAILGWRSVAPTIFIGSLAGAVIGITIALIAGTGRKTEIPFGPWLALGTVIYLFFDPPFFRF